MLKKISNLRCVRLVFFVPLLLFPFYITHSFFKFHKIERLHYYIWLWLFFKKQWICFKKLYAIFTNRIDPFTSDELPSRSYYFEVSPRYLVEATITHTHTIFFYTSDCCDYRRSNIKHLTDEHQPIRIFWIIVVKFMKERWVVEKEPARAAAVTTWLKIL